MKFALIKAERKSFPVRALCRALGVTAGGFYAWLKRPESARAMRDRVLRVHVRASFQRSNRTYGSPRVHKDLKADGQAVGRKRISRLMREEQLVARKVKRFVSTTNSEHALATAPNTLGRDFTAKDANQKWVGDITYLRTSNGWLYLATVIDLFSRRVVGHSVGDSLDSSLIADALTMASSTRDVTPGLLFHSDRGVQYASQEYRAQLAKLNAESSMSRLGNCWDNAVAESFFSSLKFELDVALDGSRSAREVAAAVARYIVFFNSQRRHSTLNYVSPNDFELAARMGRAA